MPPKIFTPSLFFKHATCPHWIWHDLYSDQKEKSEESELKIKIREQGVVHEDEYVKSLVCEKVTEVEPEVAFKQTLALMRSGAELIYQGAIQYEKDGVLYRGRPDLLEKKSGRSNFGNYYYSPVDIKSSKDIKKEQESQLILYGLILEQMQGCYPDGVAIINKEHTRYDLPKDTGSIEKVKHLIATILDVMSGNKPPLKLSSGCKDSPWFSKCISEAEEKNDIALIYKLD